MTDPTTQDQEQELGIPAVETLMQVLVKGLRAVQLYLPNNPVYQKALENIRLAFEAVWEYCDELELVVAETEFHWEGAPVLSQETKSESLAWVLYKDGIRFLALKRGVEDQEIVQLLGVIQRARTLPADAEDDLLTLLWEQEFACIRYDFVELAVDEVAPLAPSAEEAPPPPEAVRQEVQEEAEEEQAAGVVSIEDFDATPYYLDDTEINYLRSEIEREYGQDLRGNVLGMLFDLMELQTYSTVRAELIDILQNFLPYLLAVGDFHSVATVLRELRVVLERGREFLPEHREALEGVPVRLSEPDPLSQLLQSLDEAMVHPSEEDLVELFRELRPEALETVLTWLPRLTTPTVRTLLEQAAHRLAQAHPDRVARALATDDENVLLETIRLAGRLKLPPVVPALGEIVKRRGAEVRRATVEALAAIGSPLAMKELEMALADKDRDVRISAVRTLGSRGNRNALPKIEQAVVGKALKSADLTEKTAFFEAYGLLAGPPGIESLRGMLETKGFLRRKEDSQVRACAAMALGKIGTEEAKAILKDTLHADKDPLVRNAINKALREIG